MVERVDGPLAPHPGRYRVAHRTAAVAALEAHLARHVRQVRHQQFMVFKPGRMPGTAACMQISRRGAEHDLGGGQPARREVTVQRLAGCHQQRDVHAVIRHLHVLVPGMDAQGHLGIAGTELGQQPRELVRQQRGRGRDAQHAAGLARLGVHQGLGLFDAGQDLPHPLQVDRADLGERQAARGAVDEARAHVLFQPCHQARHDGGRQVQRARRGGKAAHIDDTDEGPHGSDQVHAQPPERRGAGTHRAGACGSPPWRKTARAAVRLRRAFPMGAVNSWRGTVYDVLRRCLSSAHCACRRCFT